MSFLQHATLCTCSLSHSRLILGKLYDVTINQGYFRSFMSLTCIDMSEDISFHTGLSKNCFMLLCNGIMLVR